MQTLENNMNNMEDSVKKSRIYLYLSIPVSIIAVLLVHLLKIPNPMMILIIPVVFFSYSVGYIGGILSGIISITYSLYFFSNSYPNFTFPIAYSDQNIGKISTIIIAVTAVVVLVGKLKYKYIKAILTQKEYIVNMKKINAELNETTIKAEQANKAKRDFLTIMSHEIRTPLNAVIGFANILQQKESIQPEIRAEIRKIFNSGNSLLYLVNNILDFSKIESGKLEVVPNNYEITTLLTDTIQLNTIRIGNKPITFHADIDPTLLSATNLE